MGTIFFTENPLNFRFEALGFDNVSFIGNSSDALPWIIGMSVYFTLVALVMQIKFFSKGKNFFSKFIQNVDKGL